MWKFVVIVCLVFGLVTGQRNRVHAAETSKLEDQSKPAADIKVITPDEARNYIDQSVTVEFVVQKSSAPTGKGIGFLNSERDIKSSANFTAFISNKGLKKFKAEGKIENPVVHFYQKKVQVTGKLVIFKDKPEVVIDSPDQIKIVEDGETTTGDKSK